MILRRIGLLALAAAAALTVFAYTAANAVPRSRAGEVASAVTPNQLKPPQCAALNLTAVRVGGSGGTANTLVLGTNGINFLQGGSGADCIIGGAGIDILQGNGNPAGVPDICIGGASFDIATGCEITYEIP